MVFLQPKLLKLRDRARQKVRSLGTQVMRAWTSAERSRTLIRSASPRRSASPMRRIQIGKSGSRKAAALTIKSLNYYPARERLSSYRDVAVNNGEEEVSEKPCKKTEIDVKRITVQDAISLFESKQKDDTDDNQKRRSLADISIGTNKSVLRRWSSGMGEGSARCQPEIVSKDSVPMTSNGVADGEIPKSSDEVKVASDFMSKIPSDNETTEIGVIPERQEREGSYPADVQADSNQGEEAINKLTTSAEWTKQKEAELNQMLMKMMESKPVKFGRTQTSRNQNSPSEQKGGSYDHYKERRDAKLQRENAGKRAEKEAQFRAMQQILDKSKAEMVSSNVSVGKKPATQKAQKSHTNITKSANSPSNTSKPSITKKVSSKASQLPATRKSWSSTPSPRAIGPSPARIPGGISSAGSTPTRRKPQPTVSVPQPSPKKEKSQQRQRNVKETLVENARSLKSVNERQKPAVVTKNKATKAKVTTASVENTIPSKLSLCNKGTKKSSVVPLEAKAFLRKGSGIGRGAGPVNKKKDSPQLQESLSNSVNVIEDQESGASELVSQPLDEDVVTQVHDDAVTELECQVNGHLQCSKIENLDQVAPEESNDLGGPSLNIEESTAASSLKIESEEESTISPAAWVEIEDHLELPKPCKDSTSQSTSLPSSTSIVGFI
ncbi:serine/arginine repetitive matrix protein 2-like isoform X2 [Quillaja saponaria]|uniref:Serine/arginine repetitive matrix protein 2-like isoform X2 n=1 Tax=Quillaja saponaria TaxID=32244 RepID=A0AAD7PR67_QUISA|nr:serine/arginine repetitive matrix protein 2-like isoform X2 [Quillaja saponaria]